MFNLKKIVFVFTCCLSTAVNADITPTFGIVKNIHFGAILFIPGNCQIDSNTAIITNLSPSTTCFNSTGTRGHYVIVANPNKQISIKINQRDNVGDGFVFIPNGELVSDAETLNITINVEQQIDSGTSGVVDIYIGGLFLSSEQLLPSTDYFFEKPDGIEWTELP
jgi:hypothetical protein